MIVHGFYTTGNEDIVEWSYDKPDPEEFFIEVKSVYTGICSSDAAMYQGKFQLLPKEIQGHEGLGVVTKVSKTARDATATDISVGDIVATRGEPAFCDYYNAEASQCVIVPDVNPKYILEPVACALNIFNKWAGLYNRYSETLILGSGWLSMVMVTLIRDLGDDKKITVVGHANTDFWPTMNAELVSAADFLKLDHWPWLNIIDLSDRTDLFRPDMWRENSSVVMGAEKKEPITTNFGEMLWKNTEMIFPSPRDTGFYSCMADAKCDVRDGVIETESMWTHGFSRGRVEEAFKIATERPQGFKRAYIKW